jgi:hypothetical protein
LNRKKYKEVTIVGDSTIERLGMDMCVVFCVSMRAAGLCVTVLVANLNFLFMQSDRKNLRFNKRVRERKE